MSLMTIQNKYSTNVNIYSNISANKKKKKCVKYSAIQQIFNNYSAKQINYVNIHPKYYTCPIQLFK